MIIMTTQARRQEIKWGVLFCKRKWKMGGVFCTKVDLSSTQGALCTVSVFFILHFTYLGGAYAPNAPPCLRACYRDDDDDDAASVSVLTLQPFSR